MPADFLDSNTVLYAFSTDPVKAGRAEALIAAGGIINVQVLNEIANVARRKMQLSWPDVRTALEALAALLDVRPLTLGVQKSGIALAERYKLSVYDAMIVAAALDAGCATLWSEDLHNGLTIAGQLTVANPFTS